MSVPLRFISYRTEMPIFLLDQGLVSSIDCQRLIMRIIAGIILLSSNYITDT